MIAKAKSLKPLPGRGRLRRKRHLSTAKRLLVEFLGKIGAPFQPRVVRRHDGLVGAPPPLEVLGREAKVVDEDLRARGSRARGLRQAPRGAAEIEAEFTGAAEHDWQPRCRELALKRAPLGDDDRAEEEPLPGAVAVEPRADGGQDLRRRGEDKPR